MKKIIVSLFALIAAVSSEAAFIIKHSDGTQETSITAMATAFKNTALRDGDTIYVTATYSVPARATNVPVLDAEGKTITLDLNGYKIWHGGATDTSLLPNIEVKAGTLIITDTSEGKTGEVNANPKIGRPSLLISGGTLVLDGGSYDGGFDCAVKMTGGNLVVNNGRFYSSKSGTYHIGTSEAEGGISVTLSGGTYDANVDAIVEANDNLTLDIVGGQFATKVGANISNLAGGLFANKDDDRMVDNPDSSTKSAYPYVGSAVVEDPVFVISGPNRDEAQGYQKAQDLVGVLKDGDVIVLQKDISVSDEVINLSGNAKVTFDLNGHSYDSIWGCALTVSGADMICTLVDSVGGGRLSACDANGVVRIASGTLILDGATIEASLNESRDQYYSGLELNNGTNTGHFVLKSGRVFGSPGMRFSGGGESSVTIEGGIITSPDINGSASLDDAITIGSGHQFTMTGGEIVGPRAISMTGASPMMMMLKGGVIRSTKANPILLTYAFANASIILDGATLEGGSCAFDLGTDNSKATVLSGKINTPQIMDGGVEPVLKGGWYVTKPNDEDLVISGYRQRTLSGCEPYLYEIAPRTGTDTTQIYEIPSGFVGALTVDASVEKIVGAEEGVNLKVIGTSGAEITDYVTTAADTEGVIKIDLDPVKVAAPEMNEVKFEGEEEGIAIPESVEGLTYQLLGGTSLDQIVDIHDTKTGTGEKLEFTPDASKLEGAYSAFFRIRVVK